jgi:hypothetical protein
MVKMVASLTGEAKGAREAVFSLCSDIVRAVNEIS